MDEIRLTGLNNNVSKTNETIPPLELEPKRKRGRPKKNFIQQSNERGNKLESELVDERVSGTTSEIDKPVKNESVDKRGDERGSGTTSEMNRVKAIRKITQYKNLFSDDLKGIRLNNLDDLDEEQLNDKLKQVQTIVESRRSFNSTRSMFLVGLGAMEKCDYMVGLKLQGLTNCAANSPELMLTVDEVSIKYFDRMVATDPLLRLFMGLGHLAIAVDGANRARDSQERVNNIEKKEQKIETNNETEPRDNNLFSSEFSSL